MPTTIDSVFCGDFFREENKHNITNVFCFVTITALIPQERAVASEGMFLPDIFLIEVSLQITLNFFGGQVKPVYIGLTCTLRGVDKYSVKVTPVIKLRLGLEVGVKQLDGIWDNPNAYCQQNIS